MKARAIILALLLTGCETATPPPPAPNPQPTLQLQCAHRDDAVDFLQRAGEQPQVAGVTGGGAVMEWWASPETGSWTLLLTDRAGVSCVWGAGQGWARSNPGEGA